MPPTTKRGAVRSGPFASHNWLQNSGAVDAPSDQSRADFWLLLNSALQQRIRRESRRTGPIGEEDLFDLVSEKSLDLMNRLDAGDWNPDASSPEKVVSFISTVARNGLIDLLRRSTRRVTDSEADMDGTRLSSTLRPTRHESPDDGVARTEFVEALVSCADSLQPAHRTAWIFRVFLDMPSKTIAQHPEIDRLASHVDVMLQRCREKLRDCMHGKGHDVSAVPRGTLPELWRAFRIDKLSQGGLR